ncbi:N-acetylmuramoyl-L-alanine amidase-like domain-containing protein [Candidatus Neomarinimicrobiota bacterium]
MLNRLLKIQNILILTIITSCSGDTDNQKWIESLPKPWLLNETEVTNILPEFQKRFPNFEECLKVIAKWRIGTPYEVFKLGEETPPDSDPIIRLDVSDCTVLVLTSLSIAQSKTWDKARENIVKIHYKIDENGNQIPTYKSRWHFTADRILSNPYTVNITNKFVDFDDLENVNLTLNVRDDGSELLKLDWSKKVQFSYIPNNRINSELLGKLPQVCGIAFVRKSYFKDGLAIEHEGILIDQNDLIHASSDAGKTVRVNLIDYCFNGREPFFDGIMIYKFVPIEKSKT